MLIYLINPLTLLCFPYFQHTSSTSAVRSQKWKTIRLHTSWNRKLGLQIRPFSNSFTFKKSAHTIFTRRGCVQGTIFINPLGPWVLRLFHKLSEIIFLYWYSISFILKENSNIFDGQSSHIKSVCIKSTNYISWLDSCYSITWHDSIITGHNTQSLQYSPYCLFLRLNISKYPRCHGLWYKYIFNHFHLFSTTLNCNLFLFLWFNRWWFLILGRQIRKASRVHLMLLCINQLIELLIAVSTSSFLFHLLRLEFRTSHIELQLKL